MESIPAAGSQSPEAPSSCPTCTPQGSSSKLFVYSIGKLSMRFPSTGIEREYQQRERTLFAAEKTPTAINERVAKVLRNNQHIARSVCFVQSIGGIPSYIVAPSSAEVLNSLTSAIEKSADTNAWVILIGRRGPIAPPTACSGILAPFLLCDVVYEFRLTELIESLVGRVGSFLKRKNWTKEMFTTASQDLFNRLVSMPDNLGALDGHRALNYIIAQHPGPYLAMAEYSDQAILHSIDTYPFEGSAGQKLVTVVMTFVDRNTGVPQRLSTTVDVTEEWPFVVETAATGTAPFGMVPYFETKSG